ncbi:hypothetical protein [Marilutibacter aestuarii]|uniref:Uncharacterized protein n=1 Tax=Marilutibacter aestuarii TaxID=1706195 RepID=A0A508AFG8_9GAMM|nr:hypothetical protein [Lysobacter aestuarii]TQD47663.1 hypothetical protein FKV25_05475 [Lysobacter aestuarii]
MKTDPGPSAMAFDSGVYLAWLTALHDYIHVQGEPTMLDRDTLRNLGGLMHSLSSSVDELLEREHIESHGGSD